MVAGFILVVFVFSNELYVRNSPLEICIEEVISFGNPSTKGAATVRFLFEGRHNSLPILKSTYNYFQGKFKACSIKIIYKHALYGSAIVESWEVN